MTIGRTRIRLLFEILFVLLLPILLLRLPLRSLGTGSNWQLPLFLGLLLLRGLILLRFIRLLILRFHKKYIAPKQHPDTGGTSSKANRALLGTALLVLFMLLELIFMFVPQTQDLYKMGLANKLWQLRYREPENEKRFRDKSLAGRMETKKKTLFFLGDSYTYGNGLRYSHERFTDMVYARMDSSAFEAFNLGRGNTDTRDEFVRLVDFGLKPNYLLLQYYHNDIENVGARYGHFNTSQIGYQAKKPSVLKRAATFVGLIPLQCSFFLNYTAFNSAGFFFKKGGKAYKDCLASAYADTACVNDHLRDIEAIIRYSEENNIRLYVLAIPDARDIEFTQALFDDHIAPYLRSRGVPYITVDKSFRNHKTSELIINTVNAHTSPLANSLIANEVLKAIPELTD